MAPTLDDSTEPRDVLVVDDDPAVARLVKAVLDRDGLAVDVAGDAAAALDALARLEYRLVLTDLTMPEVGGLELVRAAEQRGHRVPFLVMSAYLDPERESALCAEPAVAGIVRKPFELALLQCDVRAVLSARGVPTC